MDRPRVEHLGKLKAGRRPQPVKVNTLDGSSNTMRYRIKHKTLLFASVAIVVVGISAFFALGQSIKWVGHTDLEVRFLVTDAETGQPVSNATIQIRAEPGGFCNDPPQLEFAITTDENGHAKQRATSCMCFGSKGTFENTFALHLPKWSFHVTANGYSATDSTCLDIPANAQQVQRGDPFATLSVPIRLRKNAT